MINTVKQCTNNEENLHITSSQLVGSPMTSLFVNEISLLNLFGYWTLNIYYYYYY